MSQNSLLPASVAEQMAESATGCVGRSNLGAFYANGGAELTPEAARAAILEGKAVEVPNAGAGSYARFFQALGFSEVRTVETTSSAGDWMLAVRNNLTGCWHPAWQSNRYPRHGFSYNMEEANSFSSYEELVEMASMV